MQFLSLLLSALLAILPGFTFLAPMQEALHEASLAQRARDLMTEQQVIRTEQVMSDLRITSEELAESGMLDFFPLSLLDPNWQALTIAYTYACVYSVYDGLSVAEVLRIQFPIAARAQLVGRGLYDILLDEFWKNDACSHFLWAYHSTKIVGMEKSRIHLSNYELAVLFVRPVLKFMQGRYFEFLEEGQGEMEARWNAWVEGGAYGLNRRELVLKECETFNGWKKYYSDNELMDLWNNNRGRLAAVNAGRLGGNAFVLFLQEWDSGMLMKNDSTEATKERQRFIFENKHLWNPTVKAEA